MSNTYNFIIPGDPVPYLRMTRGQLKLLRMPARLLDEKQFLVKRRIQRYLGFKEAIQLISNRFPFDRSPKQKVYLKVMVYYGTGQHPDTDNVLKAVQDALFKNDRMVAGSGDFDYDAKNPRCEVEVTVP